MTAEIIHGDCLEVMRGMLALSGVDAVITDPPYGIGRDGQSESSGVHGGRRAYEFRGWDTERPSAEVFTAMRAIAPVQVIWGGNYFADLLPPTMGWFVWDKGQRINQSDGELAWTSRQNALRIYTKNRVEIMKDGAVHPTQKPVSLMRWCIQQLRLPPASLILDPFCGSGTTGVAAHLEGHHFIGIEREPAYVEIARKRITEAQEQLTMAVA